MPWWAQGCDTTGKMVISYDNLIRRLWLHGAIFPYETKAGGGAATATSASGSGSGGIETLLNEDGMPPVPHEHWVHRLGFQQEDPVTDFRSGGVLSLALMLHLAESCPDVFRRFVRPDGDAGVLPFGITSINITDMLSKFLMLAKTVDRMDALLSQKPFWRMFADPNAITACQELAMDMLADVVVEFRQQRGSVTVFDFSSILAKTERRVQFDLLGAGPKTVAELYQVHAKVKLRYQRMLEVEASGGDAVPVPLGKAATQLQQQQRAAPSQQGGPPMRSSTSVSASSSDPPSSSSPTNADIKDQVMHRASAIASSATNLAGSVFSRIKGPAFNPLATSNVDVAEDANVVTASTGSSTPPSSEVKAPPIDADTKTSSGAADPAENETPGSGGTQEEDEWVQAGSEISGAVEGMNMFSIEDEDDRNL
jgi:ELMO/CED-12 family